MLSRVQRWLLGAALILAVAAGVAFAGSEPSGAYGADPTPTPLQTNGNPGGSGGGGGGG
jgi:hypothetical protein